MRALISIRPNKPSMKRTPLKSQNATHIKSNDQGKDEEF